MRTIETSSGSTDCAAGLRPFGFSAIAPTIIPLFRISADTINANSGIRMEDYTVVDRRGRFVLLRKKD